MAVGICIYLLRIGIHPLLNAVPYPLCKKLSYEEFSVVEKTHKRLLKSKKAVKLTGTIFFFLYLFKNFPSWIRILNPGGKMIAVRADPD